MSERADWLSILQGIIRDMETTGVTELDLQQEDLRLRLKRSPRRAGDAQSGPAPRSEVAPVGGENPCHHPVAAPLTGVFYGSPNPSTPPFVSPGDWIEQDTVVALIETMKVFNEVTADCRGRIAATLARQGELVHTGDPIFLVDTSAVPDDTGEEAS